MNANEMNKTMNKGANGLDKSEERILAYEASDESLEAAAMASPTPTYWTSSCYAACCQR